MNPSGYHMYCRTIMMLMMLVFMHHECKAQTPSWIWAQSAGINQDESGADVGYDDSGNIYAGGSFASYIVFGSDTLTSPGFAAIFIVKYDPNGNVIWTTSFSGSAECRLTDIYTDSDGNSYLTGYFKCPTFTLDSVVLIHSTGSFNHKNAFAAKLDSSGHVVWAYAPVGSKNSSGTDISVSSSGEVWVAGEYDSTFVSFGSTSLLNTGSQTSDVFVAKFNVTGVPVMAFSFGGPDDEFLPLVGLTPGGSVVLAFNFESNSITIGSSTIISSGAVDCLVALFDSSMSLQWHVSSNGLDDNRINSLTVASTGDIYIAGNFKGVSMSLGGVTFINGSSISGYFDSYVLRLNATGTGVWSWSAIGLGSEYITDIELSSVGELWISGAFLINQISLGISTYPNFGSFDFFIAAFDVSGSVIYSTAIGGVGGDGINGISLNSNGNLVVTGSFGSPMLHFGNYTVYNAINPDYFIAELATTSGLGVPFAFGNSSLLMPNPTSGIIKLFYAPEYAGGFLKLYNLNGEIVFQDGLDKYGYLELDLSDLPKGIYVVQLMDKGIVRSVKEKIMLLN